MHVRFFSMGTASLLFLAPAFTCLSSAQAAVTPQACAEIIADADRLRCYDAAVRVQPARADPATRVPLQSDAQAVEPVATPMLTLSRIWEIDPTDKRGVLRFVPHRANYVLPVRYSDQVNTTPTSPGAGRTAARPTDLSKTEAKFQLSFKVKALENTFGDNGDLWVAYTQQSNWQIYNSELSSPFRETDYEPELIYAWRTDATLLGWHWRLLNLGLVHQSNGRSEPESRSWNRVYAQAGLERGNWSLLVRPWYAFDLGDNPDIRDYMGSGDLRLTHAAGGHVISALARYSLSGRRGAAQLDWAFPIAGALKGYVQAFSGYGETLLDYNHKQTTLGAGLLLLPWQ